MHSFLWSVATLFACSLAPQAQADQVRASTLNCRAEPQAESPIVAKLSRGQSVSIAETRGAWSQLTTQDCWVLSRYLDVEAANSGEQSHFAYDSRYRSRAQRLSTPTLSFPQLSSPSKKRSVATRKHSSASSSKRSRSSSFRSYGNGGSCPCSGGNICIGPRGGRYCITSGGNKRYGV